MLQTLDQMFTAAPAVVPPPNRTWAAIPAFLKKEVAAGASSSARTKAQTAVQQLAQGKEAHARERAYQPRLVRPGVSRRWVGSDHAVRARRLDRLSSIACGQSSRE